MSTKIVVGDWSVEVDPTSPYYNTIFSALDETPPELVFGESWSWLPERWPTWEILKERLDRYGLDAPEHEEPIIYYDEVELLQRAFLDLPEHWRSFVALRDSADGVNEEYFALVGKYSPRLTFEEDLPTFDGSLTMVSLWVDVVNRLLFYENLYAVGYQGRHHREEYEDMRDYDEITMDRFNAWQQGEKGDCDLSRVERVRHILRGVWDNAYVSSPSVSHLSLWWEWLYREAYDIYEMISEQENLPYWSNQGNASMMFGSEDTGHGDKLLESLAVYTGHSSPFYIERSRQLGRTVRLAQPYTTAGVTLYPDVYSRALKVWHDDYKVLLRGLGEAERGTSLQSELETWPSTVNSYIASRVVRLAGSRIDVDMVALALLSVIGRKHARAIVVGLSLRSENSTANAMSLRLEKDTDLPEEMLDFPTEAELDHYLKRVLKL